MNRRQFLILLASLPSMFLPWRYLGKPKERVVSGCLPNCLPMGINTNVPVAELDVKRNNRQFIPLIFRIQ